MTDSMSYPSSEMHATARTLRTTLDSAWAHHVQILKKSILEPATELGNKVAIPFQTDITTWNQSMLECYDALYALASTLDGGATIMPEQDQGIAKGFQREEL
jgi:uncharacterized protein YukE